MAHGGLSRAVRKLLRPFHRRHKADDAATPTKRGSVTSTTSSCSTTSSSRCSGGFRNVTGAKVFTLKSDGDGIPHTIMMPPALFRQMRALGEQAAVLVNGEQQRASHKGGRESMSSSRSGSMWRGDLTTKYIERLTTLLTEDDADGFASTLGRRSAKPVPLETGAKAMLQIWKCCMQILDVLADSAAPEATSRHTVAHARDSVFVPAFEKRRQLEQATLTLLALVIRRQEFDALLVAAAHGGCKVHKPTEEARHGVARLSRRLSRHSKRSRSISTHSNGGKASVSSKPARKSKHGSGTTRLCDTVHQFLELHQSTLQFAFETVHGPIDSSNSSSSSSVFNSVDPHQELLAALIATSYIRVPRLRSHILDNLSNLLPSQAFNSTRSASLSSFVNSRGHGRSVYDDRLRLTPFNWHHSMYPQCQNILSTINREERWASSVVLLDQLMSDADGCMLALAQIFEQLTGQQVLGRTEWKYIPGCDTLFDAALAITKRQFVTELQQREPKWQDGAEEQAENSKEQQLFRESFSLMESNIDEANTPIAYFAAQMMNMMHENIGFVHKYLMTILQSTSYMLPHHVVLCLQYMERLVVEFPTFFVNEPAAQDFLALSDMASSNPRNDPQQDSSCADVETMRYVFSCLLDSEHFEILKATELFLLKNFTRFSVTLQLQITDLFATHVKRLFLHWNRDVRYLYYHVLLYLTYPGNRLVLSAKSDEALMGKEASQLFEIPGLVRTDGGASWDAFDVPLQQIISRYTQVTKRRQRARQQPTWVDPLPWAVVQRAVTEYKTHVKTYFAYARQLSLHQRVPTPMFSVKSVDGTSSASETPRIATALLA